MFPDQAMFPWIRTTHGFHILVIWTIALLSVEAELLPTLSPHEMCAEADAIVVGERVSANRVAVHEWILRPPQGSLAGSDVTITGLEKHGRVISERGLEQAPGQQRRRLTSQKLLCFLEAKGDSWRPLVAAEAGSSGLVWLEQGNCYRYHQLKNPGPYSLLPAGGHPTENELRAAIAQGLADRDQWEEVKTITHPEEQAIVLCSYLLERTSPERGHGTYRNRVRRVLPKLGARAVTELVLLLRNAMPGDKLGDAVLILNDLGPVARPAVPDLVALLQRPGLVDPARLIETLGRIGDASVAHQLLPFLDDELRIRAAVAGAMARFSYQDSIPLVVRSLPAAPELQAEDAYYVYAILQALHELGAEETSRLTRVYLEAPAMRHLHNLMEPFLADADR